jgi:hypothetical protein
MKYYTSKSWLSRRKYIKKLRTTIEYYRKNPVFAAEELLEIKLNWYQKYLLNNLQFVGLSFYRRK